MEPASRSHLTFRHSRVNSVLSLDAVRRSFVVHFCQNKSCAHEERNLHSKWSFSLNVAQLRGHANKRWPTEVTSNTYFRCVRRFRFRCCSGATPCCRKCRPWRDTGSSSLLPTACHSWSPAWPTTSARYIDIMRLGVAVETPGLSSRFGEIVLLTLICILFNLYVICLTLSLPRVIKFNFLLHSHQQYYIAQYEELGFS